MNNTISYKGYIGSLEFSEEDSIFYGKVQGIRSLISYEGSNAMELISDFHAAIDDYLSMCEAEDREPEKSFNGCFNVCISPELHKAAAIYALNHEMTLNSLVKECLCKEVSL